MYNILNKSEKGELTLSNFLSIFVNANIFNELQKATETELEFGIAKPELTYILLPNINIILFTQSFCIDTQHIPKGDWGDTCPLIYVRGTLRCHPNLNFHAAHIND